MQLVRLAAAGLLGLAGLAQAHNIPLRGHSRECFHENLHKDDHMTITYQVGDREFGGSGNIEIDFWVRSFHFALSRGEQGWDLHCNLAEDIPEETHFP